MALDTQPSSAKMLEQLIERVWHVGNCIERSSGSVTSSPCCCVPPRLIELRNKNALENGIRLEDRRWLVR